MGDPVCGIVFGWVVMALVAVVVVVEEAVPLTLFSTILVIFGVGVVLRANIDSKNPFFLAMGVGVTVIIFGVGVAFTFLNASSLSERFTRDPNTNKNTSTTMSPRMKEVALLKPLMAEL